MILSLQPVLVTWLHANSCKRDGETQGRCVLCKGKGQSICLAFCLSMRPPVLSLTPLQRGSQTNGPLFSHSHRSGKRSGTTAQKRQPVEHVQWNRSNCFTTPHQHLPCPRPPPQLGSDTHSIGRESREVAFLLSVTKRLSSGSIKLEEKMVELIGSQRLHQLRLMWSC